MSLKSLLKGKQVVSCSPDTTVQDVARLMDENDVGCVVISEKGKLKGVVTDRDLTIRCLSQGKDCHQSEVGRFMTSPVDTIDQDAGIHELIEMMKENEIRRVVVVDQKQMPLTVVSVGDVLELLSTELGKLCVDFPKEEKLMRNEQAA